MEWNRIGKTFISKGINGQYIIREIEGKWHYTTPNKYGQVSGNCISLEYAIKVCEQAEQCAIETLNENELLYDVPLCEDPIIY